MSLMSFTGKQRNLLDETPEHCRQLKLPHPILTNDDVERLRAGRGAATSRWSTLPAVFRRRRDRPRASTCARPWTNWSTRPSGPSSDGASLLIVSDREVSPSTAAIPSLLATSAAAPRPVGPAAAERGGHRGRERRAARGDALLPAVRLRGQRRQSLPGVRGHPQAARRRRPAGRRAASTS